MNEQKYNPQDLAAYLLGSLADAEAERFDELSFTDEEFADALASAENDLVDRYVRGELAGATLEQFKTHYLTSPLRREKVRFAETFQTYARRGAAVETQNVVVKKSESAQTSGFFSLLDVFGLNNRSVLQWGLAAASVLIVLGGIWLFSSRTNRLIEEAAVENPPPDRESNAAKQIERREAENSNAAPEIVATAATNSETESPSNKLTNASEKIPSIAQTNKLPKSGKPSAPKISIASFILAPALRSNQLAELSIPKETTEIRIGLELEADDYSTYRVALVGASGGASLWQSGAVKAVGKGENQRLDIRFPAKILKADIYTLNVSGIGADGAAEDVVSSYTFRSVIK